MRFDEALVCEQLKRRVHRPGAWLPRAVTTVFNLVDDLITVHGLLGEQREDCYPHVAATHPWSYAALEFASQIIEGVPEAETWLAGCVGEWTAVRVTSTGAKCAIHVDPPLSG
jgi:hypothetical protein